MGWYKEMSDGIFEALCAAFGLDPESIDSLRKFVPAYVDDAITPQAPKDLDVCYFAIGNFNGDSGFNYVMQRQVIREGVTYTEQRKTVPASVLLTFYGPNADDEAEEFWSLFQLNSGAKSPRAVLRKRNIVPIGEPERPVSLYEVEDTYQRRRCDVRVNLAYYETREFESTEVDTPPEIVFQPQHNK